MDAPYGVMGIVYHLNRPRKYFIVRWWNEI